MSVLDDERVVDDAWFFMARGSFRPLRGLEIGITRTAQWCGVNRPCSLGTFGDLLLGNDNRGVNVDAEDEPGNQLGGFDIRWVLPKDLPVALYMQWIGEDGRGGGGAIGSWLRQLGAEYWRQVGNFSHRTHIEISDTMCRKGVSVSVTENRIVVMSMVRTRPGIGTKVDRLAMVPMATQEQYLLGRRWSPMTGKAGTSRYATSR